MTDWGPQPDRGGHPGATYGRPPAYPGEYGAPAGGRTGPVQPIGPPDGDRAHWGRRAGGYLVDNLIVAVPVLILLLALTAGYGHQATVRTADGGLRTVTQLSAGAQQVVDLADLLALLFGLWNAVIRQGRTGQSLGKTAVGIVVVSAADGRPLGVGRCLLRQICHVLDALTVVGYLWPLWDRERQTFADKIVGSVVLRGGPRRR